MRFARNEDASCLTEGQTGQYEEPGSPTGILGKSTLSLSQVGSTIHTDAEAPKQVLVWKFCFEEQEMVSVFPSHQLIATDVSSCSPGYT